MTGHPPLEEIGLDLVEGTLGAAEAERVRAHLAGCPTCRERLEEIASAHALSARAGRTIAAEADAAPPPAAEVDERILAAARSAAAPARPARSWRRRAVPIGAGALVAAAVAIALVTVRQQQPGGDGEPLADALARIADPRVELGRMRGGEPASDPRIVARELAEALAAGELRVERSRGSPCAADERGRFGLVAPDGRLRAFAWALAGGTELHLFTKDGAGAGAFAIDASGGPLRPVSPLRVEEARMALDGSGCAYLRKR